MVKHIEIIEVVKLEEGVIKETQPHLFKLDAIDRIRTSEYSGCSWLYPSNSLDRMLIKGDYKANKTLIDETREAIDPKLCYVFRQKVGGMEYCHYVPSDEVSRVMVNKGTNHVSLILKTGDRLDTGMVMSDLKNTLIEVRF